jgi:hypothetical protein
VQHQRILAAARSYGQDHGSTALTLSVHLAHRVTTALGSTVMTGPVRR